MASQSMSASLRRRWYVALVGILVTFGIGLLTLLAVSPTYQAKRSLLLISPPASAGDNPYLDMTGLTGLADVVATNVTSSTSAQSVAGVADHGSFTVTRDQTTSAPILLIVGNGRTAKGALDTAKAAARLITPALNTLQTTAAVPTRARVGVSTVAFDRTASVVVKTQLRAVLAVIIIGLALTVIATAFLDRALLRRQARRAVEPEPPALGPESARAGPVNTVPIADAVAARTGESEPAASRRRLRPPQPGRFEEPASDDRFTPAEQSRATGR